MSSSGTTKLAGILDQCSHGIPAEQTNMAACTLLMQMCPVSFTDGSELSSCSSLRQWTSQRACHTHTHTHANSTHKRWLSKPNRKERHYWDKYVSAWGLGCYHPIGKAVVVWGKKTTTSAYWFWQSVCWLVSNVFSYNHTDAVEFVKNETEWFMLMMFDSSCIKPSQSSVCRVF